MASVRLAARTTATVASMLVAVASSCASRPAPLDPSTPVLTICEAVLQPVGTRIAVRGRYFGYSVGPNNSSAIILESPSPEKCHSLGAGRVIAELWDREELAVGGTIVEGEIEIGRTIVEGEIAKVEDLRIVTLKRSIVRPMMPRFIA